MSNKNEIVEGNMAIAEFMGYDWQNNVVSEIDYEQEFIQEVDRPMTEDDLQYHTSWDWLMPVVEKISKIKCMWTNAEAHESDTYYTRTFGMLNEETKNPMVRINSNQVFEAPTLIEATWLAVADFIKWYNSQQ